MHPNLLDIELLDESVWLNDSDKHTERDNGNNANTNEIQASNNSQGSVNIFQEYEDYQKQIQVQPDNSRLLEDLQVTLRNMQIQAKGSSKVSTKIDVN